MNKTKVIITGGAGFIGSNISKLLYKHGFEIYIIDNFNPQIHGSVKEESYLYNEIKSIATIYNEDILHSKSLDQLLEKCDVLIHLAAETGTGQSMYDIEKYVKTNSLGTAYLLEKLLKKKNSIRRFILSSSRSVYGEGEYYCDKHGIVNPSSRQVNDMKKGDFECKCPICSNVIDPRPTTEYCNVSPLSIYATTKFNQEQLVSNTCSSINIPFTIFRFQNVYGKGQSINNPYTGILSIFSKLIQENRNINVFEDGMESRDFIHVTDVASAIYLDIKSDIINQTYNVGFGKPTNVIEVVKSLEKAFERNVNYEISGAFRIGDIRHNFADISRISSNLGFSPKVNFQEGVNDLVDWIISESQSSSELSFEDSLKEMQKYNLLIK
jgi:dTDP-L-rhamnose 4-epimerase